MRIAAGAAALGGVMIGLAACGEDAATAPAGEKSAAPPSATSKPTSTVPSAMPLALHNIKVCELLTAEDVAAAVGRPLMMGDPEPRSGVKRAMGCRSFSEAQGDDVFVSLDVAVWPSANELQGYIDTALGGPSVAVGDRAVWANDQMVAAAKGTVQLNVRIGGAHGLDAETLRARTVTLAQAAAARLP